MAKDSNKKEEKVTKSDVNKNKKSGFKDFKAELKKVVWPTPKELVNSTVAVITIVLITAIIVFVLDVAFESLNTYGIDKIRSSVSNSVQSSDNQTNTNNENVSTDNEVSNDTENVAGNEVTGNVTNNTTEPNNETSGNVTEPEGDIGTPATTEQQ